MVNGGVGILVVFFFSFSGYSHVGVSFEGRGEERMRIISKSKEKSGG